MPILTENQAIALVNKIVGQSGYGPEYRVQQIQSTSFGWVLHWLPQNPEKDIAGSGPYLVNKNTGKVREFNSVAHDNNLNSKNVNAVLEAFAKESSTNIKY
jgi:hypothetical protein